jgi:hypothetical protein
MGAPGIAELSASGQNLLWYDAEDATEPVGEGSIFFTEFVSESATYYVESNIQYGGEEETGGKATNAGAGSLPSTGAHSFFNAWEPFTIETVRVYVPSNSTAGVRTVQLVDGSGVVLQTATFDLEVGEHVIELNFDVPVGNGMSLRCPEHTLFRNSGGVTYPYAIGSVGEIYDSVYGASYYYYFYDWSIRKQAFYCSSPRVAVNVTVVSVENIEGVESFNVYPNPSNGVLNIELELTQAADIAIRLVDMAGRTVVAEELNQNQLQVRHVLNTDAAAGVYQLVIELNGAQITQKVIID